MVVTKINLFGDLPAISVVWSVISTLSAAIEKDSSLFSLFFEAVHESRKRLTATRNPRGVWGLGGVWSWWILDWTTAPHLPPLPSKVNASSTTESSRRLIPPPQLIGAEGQCSVASMGPGDRKALITMEDQPLQMWSQTCSNTVQLSPRSPPTSQCGRLGENFA